MRRSGGGGKEGLFRGKDPFARNLGKKSRQNASSDEEAVRCVVPAIA